ncbi:hypothetical protein H632_c4609p0 [Helicosporidium sp. ATCC 50920]|nr:hypothetical protein H632_c4609p0 [Helicosporidium sp. ATCC 50920]|eukprot:KDD71658.1 hypothetical protein H632_c4609p0 [Helicosporidium sp. ATCC 50920]
MLRRRSNTTRVEKDGALSWRVEWVWPQGARTVLARVAEDTTLQEALRMAVERAAKGADPGLDGTLDQSNAHILMRRERTPANAVEYMDLDRSATIAQALRGKDIVEFPTFLVVPPETLGEFTLHVAA